jgi:hypothetical protein
MGGMRWSSGSRLGIWLQRRREGILDFPMYAHCVLASCPAGFMLTTPSALRGQLSVYSHLAASTKIIVRPGPRSAQLPVISFCQDRCSGLCGSRCRSFVYCKMKRESPARRAQSIISSWLIGFLEHAWRVHV